jgi:hypothetical protein
MNKLLLYPLREEENQKYMITQVMIKYIYGR